MVWFHFLKPVIGIVTVYVMAAFWSSSLLAPGGGSVSISIYLSFVVIQLLKCPTACDPINCSMSGFSVLHYLPGVSNSYPLSQWCHPTISCSVTSFSSNPQSFLASWSFPMSQLFASRWPKYWSFSWRRSTSNEYSGLIAFRIDWFDLLAVHGTLKSRLQPHSSKALIFQLSAIFMIQLSYLYITTGKTIALMRWTFVGKVMSLLFNMLLRFV